MKKITKYYKNIRIPSIALLSLICFVLCLVFPLTQGGVKVYANTFIVKLNGTSVGVTNNRELAEDAIKEARLKIAKETESMVFIDVDVEINKSEGEQDTVKSDNELKKAVYMTLKDENAKQANLKQAYVVNIGEFKVALSSKDEVITLLDRVKDKYDKDKEYSIDLVENSEDNSNSWKLNLEKVQTQANDTNKVMGSNQKTSNNTQTEKDKKSSEITDLEFTQDVQVVETYVKQDKIYDLNTAVDLAESSVVVKKENHYSEKYNSETKYIYNDSKYADQKKVVNKGQAGYKEVTEVVEFINGKEVKREITSEKITKESKPKVVEVGTLAVPTFIRPISGGRTTSFFGVRGSGFHLGHDWGIPIGTPVKASCPGTVLTAGWNGSYGYSVLLQHAQGIQTRYGHLSEIFVNAGQKVKQGQKIGLSGNSGNSTGPHLHFEVLKFGTQVNPLDYVNEY